MVLRPASNGGAKTKAVRLTDIDIRVRRRFGWALIERAKEDGNLVAAVELTAAVENPSDRVYWLPETAVRRVLG